MTNEEIIFKTSLQLMKNGVLKGSGKFVRVLDENGKVQVIEAPEEIHTFNGWKERGFIVKKGEKSKIKFPIWKHTTKMLNTNTGNEENDRMNAIINSEGGQSNIFSKLSAFFTAEQVEKIKA